MRFQNLDHLHKTAAFAGVHVAIAVSLGYLFTGSFVLAGLVTLIEPALNTAAHAAFEAWWVRKRGVEPSVLKTAYFAAIHYVNAVAVVWTVTGSIAIAGALAFIEPLVNSVALLVLDRWWAKRAVVADPTSQRAQAVLPCASAGAMGCA